MRLEGLGQLKNWVKKSKSHCDERNTEHLRPGIDFTCSTYARCVGNALFLVFQRFVAMAIDTQRSVVIAFFAVGTQQFPSIRCHGCICSHCSRCAATDVNRTRYVTSNHNSGSSLLHF